MRNVQPIILAAGKGTRMGGNLPKALVTFRDEPMLAHVVRAARKALPHTPPVIVVGHRADDVKAALKGTLRYARQEEQRGTGHAVSCALPALERETTRIVVLYTDHPLITPETIAMLANGHTETKTVITMGTVTVPDFAGWHSCFERFGRVVRNESGAITGIREWKDAAENERAIREVSPSFFCFDRTWLQKTLTKINHFNAADEYYLTDAVAIAVAEGHSIATITINPAEAIGINTPQDLACAEKI